MEKEKMDKGLDPDRITIQMADLSDWEAELLNEVRYRPKRGGEPNWFHRKMQELCFGIKWRKI